MIARLDRILGSVTMYLQVIIALAILGVAALVGSLIGQISYPVPDILLSAAVLLIATLGSNRLIGMLLAEQHDEWAAGDRRYFSVNSMKQLEAGPEALAIEDRAHAAK